MFTAIVVVSFFAWIGLAVTAVVKRLQKKKGRLWVYSTAAFIISIIASALAPNSSTSAASSPPSTKTEVVDAPATDAPAPEVRETSVAQAKAAFLAGVDSSITATKVEGNPTKYVGSNVKWACTITNVVTDGDNKFANASCGDDPANIVLTGDRVSDLDAKQQLTVIGVVVDPMKGTNTFGGARSFPTVEMRYNL